MIPAHIEHVFKALDRIERREPQQPMPGNPALVEGSSPTAGIGTADAGTFLAQYRQEVYGYERLIEQLHDLARANRYDELHDLVRAKYLSIHGEPR